MATRSFRPFAEIVGFAQVQFALAQRARPVMLYPHPRGKPRRLPSGPFHGLNWPHHPSICIAASSRFIAYKLDRMENGMSAITTYAKPKDDFLTIRVPNGYDSCPFKVILFPILDDYMNFDANKRSEHGAIDCTFDTDRIQQQANEGLKSLAGTWVSDPTDEKVFDEMRTVDAELWK